MDWLKKLLEDYTKDNNEAAIMGSDTNTKLLEDYTNDNKEAAIKGSDTNTKLMEDYTKENKEPAMKGSDTKVMDEKKKSKISKLSFRMSSFKRK